MDARTAHYRDRVRELEDEIAELKVKLEKLEIDKLSAGTTPETPRRPR